jgi:hypothetical protein
MQSNHDVYFATLTGKDFHDELLKRVTEYRNRVQTVGLVSLWGLSIGNNYGVSPDGKLSWRVTEAGDAGELVQMKVNEYGSYVRHQLVLAIQQRPAGIAKAINRDTKTLRDARIGSQVAEYYLTDPAHGFEKDYAMAMLMALLTAESYVVKDWDPNAGTEVRPDEAGKPIMNGDLTQTVYSVWNAARDWRHPDGKNPWYIFSRRVNKWELAAKYPAYAQEIIKQSYTQSVAQPYFCDPLSPDDDYIEEHYFIHFPTPALPNGRIARFTSDVVFLNVDEYPYPTRNVIRATDQEMIESSFGHTSNYDLLGIEQVTDCLDSITLNNLSTFGMATIVGPKGGDGGSGVFHKDLGKGLRYLEMDAQQANAIKVLDLCRNPKEIFEFRELLARKKGEITGINSILRGDPQGALKGASGSAMALLQSQALVYNSGVQTSFYRLLSAGGTCDIEILRTFADEPRIARLAGKANAKAIKEFKYDKKTLEAVSTIVYEPVNPVLQTAAGKLTVAENLLKNNMVTSPKRYLEVLTTGNLDSLIGDDVAMQDAILEENEDLAEGKPVLVVDTENHEEHIAGHMSVIATPNAKEDPLLVRRTLEHIQSHVDMWQMLSATNPALLLATQQKVLPVGGAMPPGTPPAAAAGGGAPDPARAADPAAGGPADRQPQLPKPPMDPATGQDAPVAAGTSVRQAA